AGRSARSSRKSPRATGSASPASTSFGSASWRRFIRPAAPLRRSSNGGANGGGAISETMDSRPLETRSGPLANRLGRVLINALSVSAASQCPLRSESGRSAAAPRMVALCQSRPNGPLNNGKGERPQPANLPTDAARAGTPRRDSRSLPSLEERFLDHGGPKARHRAPVDVLPATPPRAP